MLPLSVAAFVAVAVVGGVLNETDLVVVFVVVVVVVVEDGDCGDCSEERSPLPVAAD